MVAGNMDGDTYYIVFPLSRNGIFAKCFQRFLDSVGKLGYAGAEAQTRELTLNVSLASSLSSASSSGEDALDRKRFLGGLGVTLCSSTSLERRFVLSSNFDMKKKKKEKRERNSLQMRRSRFS